MTVGPVHRRSLLAGALLTGAPLAARATQEEGVRHAADVAWLIRTIGERYAYLPDRHLDLARMGRIHGALARRARGRTAFLRVLEALVAELHDHHAELGVNDDDSPQLVPTGAEIWARVADGRAIIDEVRPGSPAADAHLTAGDEIVAFAGVPATQVIEQAGPRCLAAHDPEAADFTLRVLLAGTHRTRPAFTVRDRSGAERVVALPPHVEAPRGPLLSARQAAPGVALIRVNNSLGEEGLPAAFDAALASARDARGLILDLRDTPSGGDTDVAEPILGRFIAARQRYQRFFDPAPGKSYPKDSWARFVDPRGPFTAAMRLVVLVDRWTGSMGEGMAVGFDAMGRGVVVGTRMAGLCGATHRFTLPASGIGVNFPVERAYHLDGTPRERWAPPVLVDLTGAKGDDPILARGLQALA